jgi:hypothetical protein
MLALSLAENYTLFSPLHWIQSNSPVKPLTHPSRLGFRTRAYAPWSIPIFATVTSIGTLHRTTCEVTPQIDQNEFITQYFDLAMLFFIQFYVSQLIVSVLSHSFQAVNNMKNTDYFSWKTRRKQTFAPQAVVKFIETSADCVMLLAVSSTQRWVSATRWLPVVRRSDLLMRLGREVRQWNLAGSVIWMPPNLFTSW